MIVKKESLNQLKDFGLNTYESKLWTALLSRGTSTAGELSDIAHVPRSRSYDVLESLEKKGFILMKSGKPLKYVAVPPEDVIERVKTRVIERSEEHLSIMRELEKSGMLAELRTIHEKGVENIEPTDMTGSLRGRTNVYNHLESMIRRSTKSVKLLTTPAGFVRKQKILADALKDARSRNVLVQIAAPLKNASRDTLRALEGKALVKTTTLDGRMMILDDREIVFMLLNDSAVHESYDVAIWIQSPTLAKSLSELFDMHWAKMDPVN